MAARGVRLPEERGCARLRVSDPRRAGVCGAAVGGGSQTAAASVAVEGTQFRVTLADGRVLPQEALKGVVLTFGDGSGQKRRIRIDSVERDRGTRRARSALRALRAGSAERRMAQRLPARSAERLLIYASRPFTSDERYEARAGKLLITCTGGAEGKCVLRL